MGGDGTHETIERSVTIPEAMQSELREEFPLLKSDQDRIVTAVQLFLSKDDPATPGDVHHEIQSVVDHDDHEATVVDVLDRLDRLENRLQRLQCTPRPQLSND